MFFPVLGCGCTIRHFDAERNPIYNDIMNGEHLRRWRKERKWRTQQLADALGYKRRQIERLESQGAKPIRRCIILALLAIDAGLTPEVPCLSDTVSVTS